jgi:hypothetical protein
MRSAAVATTATVSAKWQDGTALGNRYHAHLQQRVGR